MHIEHYPSKTRPSVFIIIPAHNRRSVTLRCLGVLQDNGDLERYHVIVVDDGSTDGTYEAIRTAYPSVILIQGDGNLWWTGAITKGMEYAYHHDADFFIWLNDDTLPLSSAISRLVRHCSDLTKRIATAQCYATDLLIEPTYGGQIKHLTFIELISTAKGEKKNCDCMSGNLVCLPRSVVEDIGYPPAKTLPHCQADIVYTLMAKRAGYSLQVLGDSIGICAFNDTDEGWASSPVPMIRRWRDITSRKSTIHPPTYWVYCYRVFGLFGILLFIWVYIKLIGFTIIRFVLPLTWLRYLKKIKDLTFQATFR